MKHCPTSTWRWRWTAITLVLGLLCAATGPLAAAGEPDDLDGLPIVSVKVVRLNIFDTSKPETSNWFYRGANAVHILTRERFIRSMLIFKEGDRYSARRAEESARILRSLGFLNPVHITPERVDGGVEVTVQTHDRWTLEVGGEFGILGERSSHAFAFTEENFLGWGREVSIEYESDNERDSWAYGYADPNILGSRWRARLRHEDSTDGYHDLVRVEYPFYSLETRHSWGLEWNEHRRNEHLYSESETVILGRRLTKDWRLWHGIRLNRTRDITRRLIVGWDHLRWSYADWRYVEDNSPVRAPDDISVDGLRLEYHQIADRFVVLKGFRGWSAQEDVALGPNFNVAVVLSRPDFGGDLRRTLIDGRFSMAKKYDGWLLLADGWMKGRFDRNDLRNFRAGVEVVAAQLGQRGWQARLLVEETHEPDADLQLTLGADLGLRGWDPDHFDGTGRAVANLQWRSLIWEDVADLLSLGVVFFSDAGYTWDARVGRGTGRIRGDIGIGLLADLKQISLSRLLRLSLALPDDGSGPVFTVTSSSLF